MFRIEESNPAEQGPRCAVFVRYSGRGIYASPWAGCLDEITGDWAGVHGTVKTAKGFIFVSERAFPYFRELMDKKKMAYKIYTEL